VGGPPTEEEIAFRKMLEDALRPGGKTSGDTDPGDEDGIANVSGLVGQSAIATHVVHIKGRDMLTNPVGVEPQTGGPVGEIETGLGGPGFDGSSGDGEFDPNSGPQGAQRKDDGPESLFSSPSPVATFPSSKSSEEEDEDARKSVLSRFDISSKSDDDSDGADD
jgi:hypothetical protein